MTIQAERLVLLDPTSAPIPVAPGAMAPRPRSLEGLRLGILANSKPFSRELLELLAEKLQHDYGIASIATWTKRTFAVVAPGVLLDEVAARSDVVLTAIGD